MTTTGARPRNRLNRMPLETALESYYPVRGQDDGRVNQKVAIARRRAVHIALSPGRSSTRQRAAPRACLRVRYTLSSGQSWTGRSGDMGGKRPRFSASQDAFEPSVDVTKHR